MSDLTLLCVTLLYGARQVALSLVVVPTVRANSIQGAQGQESVVKHLHALLDPGSRRERTR